MKKDAEVLLYMKERRKGTSQQVAAARAGMSERTARRYERAGKLPSQFKEPRTWRTRENPFEDEWPWVVEQLQRDPALQGATLFALLCAQHPGKYRPTQVRTLQRQIAAWKATQGPEKEVYFEQVHTPGERAQSDFTHMEDLNITLAGEPFPHLLYHCVLTYSNVEAVSVCFAETFEALAEGIERALWQFGGVPMEHRTDHLSAAVRRLDKEGREDWTQRYQALMQHYAMTPTTNNVGVAHENGDVEQSHYRFQQAVDQALRVRGSRDFADRASYERFLQDLVRYRNQTRALRYAQEQQTLRPLPTQPLAPCRELRVSVSRFSTIMVQGNTYSVPSRLIGTTLLVRVRAEHLEGYLGSKQVVTLPRLHGHAQHAVNYHHIIWSLVRKPGPLRPIAIATIFIPLWPFAGPTIGSRAPHPCAPIASMCGRCIWRQRSQRPRWRPRCCSWRMQARYQPRKRYASSFAQLLRSRWRRCRSICNPTISCYPRRGAPMPDRQEELTAMPRELRLPTMASSCAQVALKASKENLTHEGFLYELARLECEERTQRRIERHLNQSKLPREKTFRTFQWERLSTSLRLHIERLRGGQFVTHAHNVIAVGPPGVGKSHFAAALGHELIQQGQTVLWTSTATLVQRLLSAKRELRLPQEIAKLQQVACLILDDIGYVQQDRDEMEVLFTLLAERYEQRSVVITTNLVFSAWDRIFKDPMTTLAAVDRVVHHSVILDMTGVESFRATQAQEDHTPERTALAAPVITPTP